MWLGRSQPNQHPTQTSFLSPQRALRTGASLGRRGTRRRGRLGLLRSGGGRLGGRCRGRRGAAGGLRHVVGVAAVGRADGDGGDVLGLERLFWLFFGGGFGVEVGVLVVLVLWFGEAG